MELKKPRDLRTYHFIEDRIKLIGLVIDGETKLDFTNSSTPEEMMQEMRGSNAEIRLYAAERIYQKSRELDAFELMEQGALISKDGAMYKLLYDLRSSQYN